MTVEQNPGSDMPDSAHLRQPSNEAAALQEGLGDDLLPADYVLSPKELLLQKARNARFRQLALGGRLAEIGIDASTHPRYQRAQREFVIAQQALQEHQGIY